MTYSIVARDPATGELGVAVQTRWPNVGASVPWAEAGVGAVATQSFTLESYGPLGLARMREGATAPEVLRALLAEDPGRDVRQVGIVDASGRTDAWTGPRCVREAGHVVRDDVSVQANMMERPTVWSAMAAAYDEAASRSVPLTDRLVAAMRAAEGEGGDVRGRQSAALIVVPATGPAWSRVFDLRVADHRAPLDELERLIRLQRAYRLFDETEPLAMRGDLAGAAELMEQAHAMAPEDDQLTLWTAVFYGGAGRMAEAQSLFAAAARAEPRSAEHLRRFMAAGFLPPQVGPLIDALEASTQRR
jgi:uncharacterized Ntn-hydrolase superfamily protein